MIEPANPYDCSTPGTLFTGYERIRQQMLKGVKNGKSYALLGGRRCGKTSFLLKLEDDLAKSATETHTLLPRLIDMQAIVPRNPADFFKAVYSVTVQDSDGPVAEILGYQNFLSQIDKAVPSLEKKHGANWVVVLLIDELESAMQRLPDSECLENFRNLLMLSRHRRHFRAVIAGVFSPAELKAGGSPLNNLDPEYLAVLSREQSRQILTAGFPHGLTPQLESTLLDLTGRHPYILQGVLAYLFEHEEITEASLVAAAKRFVRDRDGTFRSWLTTFREEGCALYQGMLDGTVREAPSNNALAILSYHGVIDELAENGPQIGSKIFREWFRSNYKLERPVLVAVAEPAKTQPKRKAVFVVHGRNMRLRNSLFTFLRSVGLSPLDWTQLVEATGNPTPHINEILKAGFKLANSAVIMLTPDDEARVREEFQQPDDPEYERILSPQPRPNVLFEAGMAMAYFPEKTVLVQVGWSRPFSDIAGIHSIKIDNSIGKRHDLARRLKLAGCEIIDLNSSIDWQTAGDFAIGPR